MLGIFYGGSPVRSGEPDSARSEARSEIAMATRHKNIRMMSGNLSDRVQLTKYD